MAEETKQGAVDQAQKDGAADGSPAKPEPTFETWLPEQPEQVRGMIEGHVRGLRSALDGLKATREEQAKQLAALAKKAEKGSEAEKALTEAATAAKAAESRATFYVLAHSAGVSDLELAYLAAERDRLIREDGSADLVALKAKHPSLFATPAGKPGAANAGAGTKVAPTAGSMNDFLRAATGRKP